MRNLILAFLSIVGFMFIASCSMPSMPTLGSITTDKGAYKPGEDIKIEWSNIVSAEAIDEFVIFKEGAQDDQPTRMKCANTKADSSGSCLIKCPYVKKEQVEVRLMRKGESKISSDPFVIGR